MQRAYNIAPAAMTHDVTMPGVDAWGVLRALRSDPGLSEIPIGKQPWQRAATTTTPTRGIQTTAGKDQGSCRTP